MSDKDKHEPIGKTFDETRHTLRAIATPMNCLDGSTVTAESLALRGKSMVDQLAKLTQAPKASLPCFVR